MVNKSEPDGKSQEECPSPPCSIDGRLRSVPAAGYRNGTSLNNAGENGNYWSATPNESNTQNAYNLNFNSGNFNRNNNNRNNGQSVRAVSELTPPSAPPSAARPFKLTREQLLVDLYRAYKDARRHKRGRTYQLAFEYRLEDNLVTLRDELYSRTYRPQPSTCFVIHDPKMREVFAAHFRDRIVHHLFYNYTHRLFERTFVADCYSCIKGRGTHYGIERLRHHIRSVSANHTRPAYVMKLDICGYFMHIDRGILLGLCRDTLGKMACHTSDKEGKRWGEMIDMELADYLLENIVNTDPTVNCRLLGKPEDWELLPADKSIFHSAAGCGLPIGNLSSQLFSNVYMNTFDQFMKRTLGCRHYGRYVDDCYVVAQSREWLRSLVPRIDEFLSENLRLSLNKRKLHIADARHGVQFLGAYIKPFRTYISNDSLRRIRQKLKTNRYTDYAQMDASVNSFLGVLSHYRSYRLRRVLFGYSSGLNSYGRFSRDWLKFRPASR